PPGYDEVLAGISELLSRARHSTAQAINSILTASYWEVGRRIIELEQRGHVRAAYGEGLWKRLAADLTARHGRGFSKSNIALMRAFSSNGKFSRHRRENSSPRPRVRRSPSSLAVRRTKAPTPSSYLSPRSHTSPGPFGSPGPTTSSSWRWITPTPAASTKPRRCGEGGPSVSSAARSAPNFTSGRRCRKTRLAC